VDDRKGRALAVWSNFAIHPTSFGDGQRLFSGDNPGYAAEAVERALAPHAAKDRPAVNVWTNGNQGDLSPDGEPAREGGEPVAWRTTDYAGAHAAGEKVAEGIMRAWRAAAGGLRDDLEVASAQVFLPFDGTQADGERVGPLAALGMGVVAEGVCSPVPDVAGHGHGPKMPVAGGPLVPQVSPVGVWRLGPLAVASLPSEVTTTMGRRIRAAVREAAGGAAELTAMAGLSNGYMSYTSTPEEYDACTYEGSFTLFGRQQGARFRDVLGSLSAALYAGRPAPALAPEPPPLGFGLPDLSPVRRTPGAGSALEQPAATVRGQRAAFRWQGGDPAVDARRGAAFVTVERRVGRRWQTHLTDASNADVTRRHQGDVWSHTWQTEPCTPAGDYRFRVSGRADRGAGTEAYQLASEPFTVAPLALAADGVALAGGRAAVRVRYPEPDNGALLALPRLVRDGEAVLELTDASGATRWVTARYDAAAGAFTAPASGAVAARLVRAEDGCGNTTA
jgi:neutral ceramidase